MTFGITFDLLEKDFISFLTKFKFQFSDICFKIVTGTKDSLAKELIQHNLDFIIDFEFSQMLSKEFVVENICSFKNCFAYSSKYFKFDDNSNFEDFPLILPTKESKIRKKLISFFEKNKIFVMPSFEINSNTFTLNAIEEGAGIGFVFEKSIKNKPNIKKVEMNNLIPCSNLKIIYYESAITNYTKIFIKMIKTQLDTD